MNRGERLTRKTRSAIKNALLELIQEKNYPDITVKDIVIRGNLGRSTFYKHYTSKADILVSIHKDVFERIFQSLSTKEAWYSLDPPSELVQFLEESQRLGKNPFSLSYKLGNDLDYLVSQIHRQLSEIVLENLSRSFKDEECGVCMLILSQSVSHIYSGLLTYWFNNLQSSDVRPFARDLHRMVRALVVDAVPAKSINI